MVTIEQEDGKFVISEDEGTKQKMQQRRRKDAETIYFNLLVKQAKEIGLSQSGLKRYIGEHMNKIGLSAVRAEESGPAGIDRITSRLGRTQLKEDRNDQFYYITSLNEMDEEEKVLYSRSKLGDWEAIRALSRILGDKIEQKVAKQRDEHPGKWVVVGAPTFADITNSAYYMGELISQRLNIPNVRVEIKSLEEKTGPNMTYTSWKANKKEKRLYDQLVLPEDGGLAGMNVIFIDDCSTSGSMIRVAREKLLSSGASKVIPFTIVNIDDSSGNDNLELELDKTIAKKHGSSAVLEIAGKPGNVITSRLIKVLAQSSGEEIEHLARSLESHKLMDFARSIRSYYRNNAPKSFSPLLEAQRNSAPRDNAREKEHKFDTEAKWAQAFIDTALMRAYEAKKNNENVIVALETSMIPERQMPYIQGLLAKLTLLSKEKGLDNILIRRKNGPKLATVVRNLATKTGTPNSNIIFLGDYNVLEKRAFNTFRDGLNPDEWSFFAGVELPENMPDNNYMRILEMLTKAMNLWAGKDKPKDTKSLQIVQEGKRFYKFVIPEIEPVKYELLKEIYKGQLKALRDA